MKSATRTIVSPASEPNFLVGSSDGGTALDSITLAIVERDEVIRESLRALVDRMAPELHCVASYASVQEAALGLPGIRPDVVLFDDRMLPSNGSGLIARLKADSPNTHILILSTFDPGGATFDSVCEGASGDLPKTTPAADLIQAIRWVHAGGSLMSMPLARRVRSHFQAHKARDGGVCALTRREEEVVAAVARGNDYAAIADRFGLDVSSVLGLLRGVCGKIGDPPRVTQNEDRQAGVRTVTAA